MSDDTGSLFDVQRSDGRTLWCYRYVVAFAYADFSFRTPSEKVNSLMLEFAKREAAGTFGAHFPIHVVQPDREPGAIDYPRIRVMARLSSSRIRREMDGSDLTIVWFQREPWPVPDAAALAAFESLEWEHLARDGET